MINYNNISIIAPGAFNGLYALEYLLLYDNKIHYVPDISNLYSLVSLNIGGNPITLLNTNHTGNNKQLKWFYCHNCKLLGMLSLPTLKYVNWIRLRRNQIKALRENVFEGFEQLKYVDLSDNKLSSLPKLGIGTITNLLLRRNNFYHVPNFRDFFNLTSLDLSGNYITVIPPRTLPTRMDRLYLYNNPLECLVEHCWITSQNWFKTSSLTCLDRTTRTEANPEMLCQGDSIIMYIPLF